MKIICSTVTAAILALAAGQASAQSMLEPGQTARGELTSSDSSLDDGSYFDCFAMRTEPGRRYRIELSSDAFDAYLAVLTGGCDGTLEDSDDDGAGGTDSRVDFTAEGGRVYIRANSLIEGETGSYRLSASDLGMPPPVRTAAIGWGQNRRGDLSESDAVASDESFYDCFVFSGQAGQRAVIELRSPEFDTYLALRAGGDCQGEEVDSNDDGFDDDTDSRLDVILPSSGTYSIRANSLAAGATGGYVLTLSR